MPDTQDEKPIKKRYRHRCKSCKKVSWLSFEWATAHVEAMKGWPDVRDPDFLEVYKCPKRDVWHVGHGWRRKWISLCSVSTSE